jgi:glycine cleavage system transcriptional repressor
MSGNGDPAALAVTVLGHDRPGIIAEVTGALAGLGGNLEDSSMTLLRGHFAWTLVVRTAAGPPAVRDALAHLAEQGLVVSVLALPDEPVAAPPGSAYLLSVHGGDRPGIVSGLTAVVASHGGNVTGLTTRLGAELYVLVADVDLPAGTDVERLRAELVAVAAELGVGATLQPHETDVL